MFHGLRRRLTKTPESGSQVLCPPDALASGGRNVPDELSPDHPLSNPADDRLGYAAFARNLADAIVRMSPPQGLVIALYGPWGSGKTTVLTFVQYYLDQKTDSERPIMVRFNPWWFSGHHDLTEPFFRQLLAVVNETALANRDLALNIATFAEAIGEVPLPITAPGKGVAKAIRASTADIVKLKDSIVADLQRQNRRILVVVDDIDRLTDEEVRQLFLLVKAVADFPNVIYLLAFDREAVVRAVEKAQDGLGEAYLEKIIQVPFELPLPDRISLQKMLFQKLDLLIEGTPSGLFDKVRWGNVFHDVSVHGIDRFIRTPRDVVRLVNALSVTYPPVKGEVNVVDFIGIEALRVFCPRAYKVVRENRDLFAGHSDGRSTSGVKSSELRAVFDQLLKDTVEDADQATVKAVLTHLFPRLESIWSRAGLFGGATYGAEWESTWRKDRRVCSPDVFDTYFRFSVPEGAISAAEMRAMLSLAGDADAFGVRLLELADERRADGSTRVSAFLEQFEDYTEKEIDDFSIGPIMKALFAVGDDLLRPEDETRGILSFGNDVRVGRITWQLLRRIPAESRFQVLREAIVGGRAISTIARAVADLCSEPNDRTPEPVDRGDADLFKLEGQVAELRRAALRKIRQAASEGSLIETPHLPYVLYRWQEWANPEEARTWVQGIVGDDLGLARILAKSLQKGYCQGVGNSVGEARSYLDPKWLEPFLDPNAIVDRARRLADDPGVPEEWRVATSQFLRGFELRQQGKDPSSPFLMDE